MSKVIKADFRSKSISRLKKALSDQHLSFVLITCSEPSQGGQMNVEMDYNGDPALIAYLMKSAENHLE